MRSKTNRARAERGRQVVAQYLIGQLEDFDSDAEDVGAVSMLLADIRHFCDQNDVDFDAAVSLSEVHFEDELAGIDNYLDEEESAHDGN